MKNPGIIILLLCLFAGSIEHCYTQNKPDLEVLEIERPEWDDSTLISVRVKNRGRARSGPVKLKVWDVDISPEKARELGVKRRKMWIFEENVVRVRGKGNDYDADFELFREVPALVPGEVIRIKFGVSHWVYDSNCELGAFIDCNETLKEKKEDNNKAYFFGGG